MSLKAAVERHPPALATVDVAVDSQGRALAHWEIGPVFVNAGLTLLEGQTRGA